SSPRRRGPITPGVLCYGRPLPQCRNATTRRMGPRLRGDDSWRWRTLLVLRRPALHKRLAALHLVGQRRLVDLDHDGVGLDAEVFYQRLGDVAHHPGLLLVRAAGGHAYGDLRHVGLSLCSCWLISDFAKFSI